MHVTNLELCKEMYELSGWGHEDSEDEADDDLNWWASNNPPGWEVFNPTAISELSFPGFKQLCPAYDLGYQLRKLFPDGEIDIAVTSHSACAQLYGHSIQATAQTPEDAACRLALELIKQGILKKGEL